MIKCQIIQPIKNAVSYTSVCVVLAVNAWAGDAPTALVVEDLGGGLGWRGYRIDNGLATMLVAPDLGGRVVGFAVGGRELLYTDPAWHGRVVEARRGGNSLWQSPSYGGWRFLPAPQTFWRAGDTGPWPPPPTLDYGRHEAQVGGDGAVHCHGPMEDNPLWRCVGMQLRYVWRLQPASARIEAEVHLTNLGSYPQQWALWDIAQIDVGPTRAAETPAMVAWPLRQASPSRFGSEEIFHQTGRQDDGQVARSTDGQRIELTDRGISRKVSSDSDGGWLLLYRPDLGVAIARRFPYVAKAWEWQSYPEGSSTLAVAVLAPTPVIELEAMTPIAHLDPGETLSTKQELAACAVAGAPIRVEDWGVVVADPAVAEGRLRGSLGCFDAGELQIGTGQAMVSLDVGPLKPIVIDLPWDQPLPRMLLKPHRSGGSAYTIMKGGR